MFKKILVLLLTLSVLTTCVSAIEIVNSEPNPSRVTLGDANNDGSVDIIDVALMRSHCIGTNTVSEDNFYFADVNSDEDINIIDVVWIRNAIITETDIGDSGEKGQKSREQFVKEYLSDYIDDLENYTYYEGYYDNAGYECSFDREINGIKTTDSATVYLNMDEQICYADLDNAQTFKDVEIPDYLTEEYVSEIAVKFAEENSDYIDCMYDGSYSFGLTSTEEKELAVFVGVKGHYQVYDTDCEIDTDCDIYYDDFTYALPIGFETVAIIGDKVMWYGDYIELYYNNLIPQNDYIEKTAVEFVEKNYDGDYTGSIVFDSFYVEPEPAIRGFEIIAVCCVKCDCNDPDCDDEDVVTLVLFEDKIMTQWDFYSIYYPEAYADYQCELADEFVYDYLHGDEYNENCDYYYEDCDTFRDSETGEIISIVEFTVVEYCGADWCGTESEYSLFVAVVDDEVMWYEGYATYIAVDYVESNYEYDYETEIEIGSWSIEEVPETDKMAFNVEIRVIIGYCGTEGCGAAFYDTYEVTVVDGKVVSCDAPIY